MNLEFARSVSCSTCSEFFVKYCITHDGLRVLSKHAAMTVAAVVTKSTKDIGCYYSYYYQIVLFVLAS